MEKSDILNRIKLLMEYDESKTSVENELPEQFGKIGKFAKRLFKPKVVSTVSKGTKKLGVNGLAQMKKILASRKPIKDLTGRVLTKPSELAAAYKSNKLGEATKKMVEKVYIENSIDATFKSTIIQNYASNASVVKRYAGANSKIVANDLMKKGFSKENSILIAKTITKGRPSRGLKTAGKIAAGVGAGAAAAGLGYYVGKDGKSSAAPAPGGTTSQPAYRRIGEDDFPFPYKSNNKRIKEMQICLGFPLKYQTGNYGPITQKALQDKGYDMSRGITKEIYNNVISKCSGLPPSVTQPPVDRSKDQITKMNPLPPAKVRASSPISTIKPLPVPQQQMPQPIARNQSTKVNLSRNG